MSVMILSSPKYWRVHTTSGDGAHIQWVGTFHELEKNPVQELRQHLFKSNRSLKDIADLQVVVRDLRGNFALIAQDKNGHLFACVDKIKSYPLFYAQEGKNFFVGFDPYVVKDALPNVTRNDDAILEFKMSGYVTRGETLFREVKQLRGGQSLYCDGNTPVIQDYYLFYHPETMIRKESEWIEALHTTTLDIFKRLIQRLNGRPAWVPLSGGLDSRLVIVMLKYLGYDRLQTFSYGVPGNCEANAASRIAKQLGVPWFFIPYTRAFGRKAFYTEERKQYFHFAHALSGIPTMTDFYAFYVFRKQHRIPEDAVIINGQTGDFISGGHIPAILNKALPTRANLLQGITRKHYALWTNLVTPENIARMNQRIASAIGLSLPETMDRDTAMKCYELWEWRGRQCETVIPGQRVYDFFGFSWELPLWDDAYLALWSTVPFTLKYKQTLYRRYLEKFDFYGIFRSMRFRRYTPPWYLSAISPFFVILGKQQDNYRRLLLQYWQKYAYFYSIYSYREYRQSAWYHRNPSSYLAKDIMEHEYHERTF